MGSKKKGSKRKRLIEERVEKKLKGLRDLSLEDGVKFLKSLVCEEGLRVKFEESIDVSFQLMIKAKHVVRDMLTFPHRVWKGDRRVLVFADGEKARDAEKSGALYVGGKEYIDKIRGGWLDFDVILSIPAMMKEVGKLGSFLGRKGLMPNSKFGTVTIDIAGAVKDFKEGRVDFRADKKGLLHMKVGRAGMEDEELVNNIRFLYREVLRKKPVDLKGEYIKSITVSSTMGPGIRINRNSM